MARTSKQKAPEEPGTDNAASGGARDDNTVRQKAAEKAASADDKAAGIASSKEATGTADNAAAGATGKGADKAADRAADGAADKAAAGAADGAAGQATDGAAGNSADATGDGLADEPADEAADETAGLAAERDKYLRLAAEYDNFRKRSTKEMKTAYSDAKADTIIRLLPVYDNLERALKTECSDEAFYKGVEMTMTQLTEILEGMGVTIIKAAGEPFDPNRHNAVAAIENPDLGEKTVAEEYQKGFMLGERVLRFSTVVVAN